MAVSMGPTNNAVSLARRMIVPFLAVRTQTSMAAMA